MFVILIIIALIYCALPWYVEIAAWIVNLFMPDTLPIIDELLMFVPIVTKIKNTLLLADFIEEYWKIILVAIIGLLIAIIVLVL